MATWPVLVALYLFAAAAMLLPGLFGAHPDWAYNWEGYTAWRWQTAWETAGGGPTAAVWAVTDGLMTDSGQGPLVGIPVTIGTAAAGFGLDAMRAPVSLLAALSVPLLWLLGRRLLGTGPAMLAAPLLAISPAFLLYGRTATLVGISLLPLLLSALALARVLDAPPEEGWQWRREGLLAAALLLGIFAYAPVRLFWPLTLGLLALAAWRIPARRDTLLRTALVCAAIVPAGVMVLERVTAPEPEPVAAATRYFHARGEQLVAMSTDLAEAELYVRDAPRADDAGWEAAASLVQQNVIDLGRLLLDYDTGPAPLEYWNEHGRFWPWFFLPFAVIGAVVALGTRIRSRIDVVALMPLALFLGLALPLLLTSRVHIGRLLPALPFAVLLVAAGVWSVAGWLGALGRKVGMSEAARWVAPLLAGAILLPAAVAARADMTAPLSPSREALTAAALAAWQGDARERGGAVLVEDPALGDDIERVHAATYRLDLDEVYRFVDLTGNDAEAAADARPVLFWRGALGALADGAIAQPCTRLWFVAPEIAGEFFATWRAAGCSGAPDSVMLP